MSKALEIQALEAEQMKKEIPVFHVGDMVAVTIRIIEGGKERAQTFTGTVIAKRGTGLSETFTVYRVAYGSSMDRIFTLHSPLISKIEVIRAGKVRRAKLNYLKGRSGKAAKVKESYRKEQSSSAVATLQEPEVQSEEETPSEE